MFCHHSRISHISVLMSVGEQQANSPWRLFNMKHPSWRELWNTWRECLAVSICHVVSQGLRNLVSFLDGSLICFSRLIEERVAGVGATVCLQCPAGTYYYEIVGTFKLNSPFSHCSSPENPFPPHFVCFLPSIPPLPAVQSSPLPSPSSLLNRPPPHLRSLHAQRLYIHK